MASYKDLNDSHFYATNGADEANVYFEFDDTFVCEIIHKDATVRKSVSASSSSQDEASNSANLEGSSSTTSLNSGVRRPSPSLGRGYEVFLSFRGPDTRKGFIDHFYHRLRDAGVDVFRDSENLHVGEEIGPVLLDRIERSKIGIPVFSKNYAGSKWCLREVACMMDCKDRMWQTVLPIFYDVTPNDVQHQKGVYKDAFAEYEKDDKTRIDVPKWRKALEEAGKLKGWNLHEDAKGHEGELIIKVIQRVHNDLKKGHLHVTKDLVYVDHQIAMVKRMLELGEESVKIVGFYGMGGIGKTTLAKVIYNEVLEEFDSCSFVKDIRENASDLVRLQSRLVADLSRCKYEEFSSTDEGIMALRTRFREKKVLVVLDDVDGNNQLEALLSVDWFGPGSRIIITTRNKSVLSLTSEELKYEVKELEADQAMELFCKHAFRKDSPLVHMVTVSLNIVETTGRLPLALEVIGSMLHGKEEEVWEETLEKLMQKPNVKVEEKLRISYDALETEQKEIFLDVACFFSGKRREFPMLMWKDCKLYPVSGLDELIQRSLVKVLDDDKLWMHDQLRDLGREIIKNEDANEPGNRSRLWRSEDAICVLKEWKGSSKVKAICPPLVPREKFSLTDQTFRNMPELRFLQLDCADLEGNFENVFTKLRYLHCRYSSFVDRPIKLDLINLVVLHMSWSVVGSDWDGWKLMQNALKLKVLILSHCWGLKVIEPSTACLPNSLTILSIDYCRPLLYIDLSNLVGLRKMHLHECFGLLRIVGLDSLVALEELFILYCVAIQKLPNMSRLKNLRELKIRLCLVLREIEAVGELELLEKLYIGECGELEKLPNLSQLKSLRKMKVTRCEKLGELTGLDELECLEELSICKCQGIKRLPNLSKLKVLRELWVTHCRNLQGLDGVVDGAVTLEVLIMDECTEITRLPNISSLKSLRYLSADGCEKLQENDRLEHYGSLEFVRITKRRVIPEVPVPEMSALKEALRKYEASLLSELIRSELHHQ